MTARRNRGAGFRQRRLILLAFLLIVEAVVVSTLDHEQAPRFITQPSSAGSVVSEGSTKILQCQAIGNPQPEYRWFKDDRPLGDFSSEHFLRISSIQRSDSGQYHCVARNSVGAIFSERVEVSVAYLAEIGPTANQTVSVSSGEAAVIQLSTLNSYPEPSITWESSDSPYIYGVKYVMTSKPRHQLIILDTDPLADAKAYRAKVTNGHLEFPKEEYSGWFGLSIRETGRDVVPPQIIVPPTDVKVTKGTSTTPLQCIANARPLMALETLWFKDDIPIDDTGLPFSYDLRNRTLKLISADRAHTGVYKCQVRLKSVDLDPVTASASVAVIERPILTNHVNLDTMTEFGRTVTLPCQAVGDPDPKVTWHKDTVAIDSINPRYKVGKDGTVTISNVELGDTGMWQCSATNEAGEASAYTWLRVKKPSIGRSIRSITDITAKPVMEFKKRGRILSLRDVLDDGVAVSSGLGSGNGGTRNGGNTNRYGSQPDRFATSPMWINQPADQTVFDGTDVTITCRAAGSPQPKTTWTKDGTPIRESRLQILDNGDLLIAAVRASDHGQYTCVKENGAGSINGAATLSVLVTTRIMQPPVDTKVILGHVATLQCKVSSDTAVDYKISWYHDGRPVDTNSRLSLMPDGTLEVREVRASDVGEYECRVTSDGGNATRSAKLSVVELPYAPTNVKAVLSSTSPHLANVSWAPGFDGNSPIVKYIIQMRPVSAKGMIPGPELSWSTVLRNISAEERWALASGLQAAQSYQFRVSAVNAVGEGVRSGPSNAVTLPPEPPSGPPESLVGSARSDTSIMMQWQPPAENAQNGRIFGYLVRYRLYGYGHSPWSYRNITNEAQRNYLLQDLITFKDYEIGIAAYNRKGVGVFSDSIRVQTKEGVPEATPTDIQALALNSTAVQVTWTPPDPQKINGINQGYKIFAWIGDPRDSHVVAKGPAASETVDPSYLNPMEPQTDVITGLEKYQEYYITVLCFTNPGDGPLSQPQVVRTLQDVPDPVAEFYFENVTDREVTVLWKPPKKPNGVLLGYTLTHMIKDMPSSAIVANHTSDVTSVRITDLKALTHYKFEISAWTAIGVGESRVAIIQSGVEPVLPKPPTKLGVSNIQAFSVVLQFTPGFDGNSSITRWTIEAQKGLGSSWEPAFELHHQPTARSLTVENLVPFMNYRLRVIAHNVVGPSEPSQPTQPFQTIQAPPKHAPRNVTVRAVSATELRVRWIPLQQIEWYGTPRGYNISYRRLNQRPRPADDEVVSGVILDGGNNDLEPSYSTQKPGSYDDDQGDWWWKGPHSKYVIVQDQAANSFVLTGLKEFSQYEVIVRAFNDVGSSEPSAPSRDQTRESVPKSGPKKVEAKATSSTTIVVSWTQIEPEDENGIILGYKVYFGSKTVPFRYENIHDNGTFVTTLTELRKYTTYHIQVLGYTRVGDGALSGPPVQVRTFEDLPGEPSNVSFPDVSLTMARIIWDVPSEPNGEILAYRVTYYRHKLPGFTNITEELLSTARTFRATDLRPETYYMFAVTAKTNLGWGATAHALVYTTNSRESPQAPSQPQTSPSQVQSRSITFSWTPGRDGFAPLRYYRIEFAEDSAGPWQSIAKRVNPMLTTYTCEDLKPYTEYRFRIRAFNDIGPSPWSKASNITRTLPDAPERAPEDVRVIPITRTSVRIEWTPLVKGDWNGDRKSGGYRILYRQINHFTSISHNLQQEEIHDIEADKLVLNDLIRDRNYEMQVLGFNAQGAGPASPPLTIWVGEAVPTGEPRHVTAVATSPHQVSLTWMPPRENQQNGDLLGYKIFYKNEDKQDQEEEVEVVPAATTAHMLLFMDTYTTYTIHILAFNAAGDGPRSLPVTVKTQQGIPGPPGALLFTEITMTSVQVAWNPPEKPNGEIQYYLVTYKTAEPDDSFSKEVKQRVQEPHLLVTDLDEGIAYTFSVKAYTIGYGPASEANMTTGPQEGSPTAIESLSVRETLTAFSLSWINGRSGRGPILGYLIQAKRKGEHKWETVSRTTQGPVDSYSIPYGNLQPASWYWFRAMAYNAFGVSPAAATTDPLATPAKAYGFTAQPPFYRQPVFLVIVAAAGIVLLTTVVAVLCVKSKSYKYKEEAQKAHHDESLSMDGGESGFGSLGLRQSRRKNSISKMRASIVRHGQSLSGTLGSVRNGMGSLRRVGASNQPPLGKLPPRPRPASVTYSDDDSSSVKGYDPPDDEESELTEKPSELSTTDSQATESDGESENSHPHSFVNHYANVNDTLRQNWKREARPAPPPPPPSASAQLGMPGPSGLNSNHHYNQLPPYQPQQQQQPQAGPSNYHLHVHTNPRPPSGASSVHPASTMDPYSMLPTYQPEGATGGPSGATSSGQTSTMASTSSTAPAQLNPATLRAHTRAMGQSQLHGPPRNYSSFTESEQEGSAVMSLNGGQIVMNNMAGSRAPLPGFSSFV